MISDTSHTYMYSEILTFVSPFYCFAISYLREFMRTVHTPRISPRKIIAPSPSPLRYLRATSKRASLTTNCGGFRRRLNVRSPRNEQYRTGSFLAFIEFNFDILPSFSPTLSSLYKLIPILLYFYINFWTLLICCD